MLPSADPAGRVRALEELLGDPLDAANPVGHSAVLDADRQRELLPGGEELLSKAGLHHELVPTGLGGRLDRLDAPARLLRAVFRRDFSLGLGFGAASLVAAVAVWVHGSAAQRARIAELLLDGGRISVMFHDIAHGNDFSTSSVTAFPDGAGGLLLQGHKPVVTNAARAGALVVLARTGAGRAGGAHSAILVERARVPARTLRDLPRYRADGIRGCPVGGIEFAACPAPAEALLGTAGCGTEVMLRCLQITRPLIPAMALGCADTALRTVVELSGSGGADGVRSLDARYTRAAVAGAFLDLLLCDCLLLAAIRALHVAPGDSSMPAAAAKYLVPRVLQEAADDLAAILGPRVHREEGAYGTFRKHLRDLAGMPPGHAGAAASLASLLPQLPSLARRSWPVAEAAPDALFHADGPLPPWDPAALALAARHDPLAAALREAPARLGSRRTPLATLVRQLADELAMLGEECRRLPEGEPALLANPRGFALAERYTLLAAAGACLGVWQQGNQPADPVLLLGVLGRTAVRLGLPVPAEVADSAAAAMTEVLSRCARRRTLDLYDEPLAGGTTV
ncbi:acyl-CoA dehydrogenase family protein [Streptomyces sp. NPDC003758]|uniref:Acyl-CoA dehydrogenase family protein n=1 Tax=Streptomyces cynarae TaxID=2981134 RepID=A0ABY6DYL4_9ACTN|nr:acyl-CoA dehydrogenase family protein [Streptomyces cynarae]UXY19494.1 acyl-CoA dehydrogenase family protein [Streptomyces cynarae]